MIRVLLADDHAMVRAGLKELLTATGDIEVAAEATNGHEVLAAAREGVFDVLVLDMSMPGRSGIELIKIVKAERPSLRMLVLSMHSEKQYAVRAVKAGASGYLTKESAPDELVAAIRRVAGGGAYITPETVERLVLDSQDRFNGPVHARLSDREFEVFRMIVSGRTVTDIATELNLSVKTISTHKSRILEKMEVSSQAELVRYAFQNGLLDADGAS
jgi:DNA-binding NarL/FixJ family response regulator